MPTYDYHCDTCDKTEEFVLRMSEVGTDAEPVCCNHRMRKVILTAPLGAVQRECHYVCPATGERITSWRQRANNFARNGLMDANDFTPEYTERKDRKKWEKIRSLAKLNEDTLPKGVNLDELAPPLALGAE